MRIFLLSVGIVCGLFAAIVFLNDRYDVGLRDALVFNGWVLAVGMAIQLAMRFKTRYAARVPGALPAWTHVHIVVGLVTVLTFGLHTSWSVPETLFEWTLWALFVVVAASGLFGVWLKRAFPLRLEQLEERIPFDDIAIRQQKLSTQAATLAFGSVERAGTVAVANFFADRLHDFFAGPRNILAHLGGSLRPIKQLLFQLQCIEREASEVDVGVFQELQSLVEGKNQLDFQYAHEAALKAWLFVHLPATYGLLVLSIAHVVVVYAFTSGSR